MEDKLTTAPIQAADKSQLKPEFVRIKDLRPMFGIATGTAYNLLNARKISGLVLRVRGKTSGVRLISVDSVRRYIESQMERKEGSKDA